MKYDLQLATAKNLLPSSSNILIALPVNSNIDKLAAGLSLCLVLEGAGKQVSIICDDTIRVGQANLYGIDHIKNSLPPQGGGNLVLTLEGVASLNGTIPALEKLDWYAENNNLNLVFHVLSGQSFAPVRITPKYQNSSFNIVFTIGASNLPSLGSIYQLNQQIFTNTHIVNIDNQGVNSSFGQTNIIDPQATSISEIVSNIITDLGFIIDGDSATNLLAGLFDATKNLTDSNVSADTYVCVGNLLKAGGRKPNVSQQVLPQEINTVSASNGFQSFQNPGGPKPDLSALFPQDSTSVVQSQQFQATPTNAERPVEEGVVSETIEPDWLTPKIFKGTSLG